MAVLWPPRQAPRPLGCQKLRISLQVCPQFGGFGGLPPPFVLDTIRLSKHSSWGAVDLDSWGPKRVKMKKRKHSLSMTA